jgi:RHS repeat-associated protein
VSATNGWDANKNKTSEGISGTMSDYGFAVGGSGYDDEDRLVNWERSDNNLDQAWNLSLVGDWNSITENASTQSRTHGPTHEMLTAAGASVTHDVKGNMTLIPAVLRPSSDPLTMSWDFDNRLVSADVDNDSTADVFYKWDALGRRVLRDDGTTATVFVQSGQQTIADYAAGTAASSPTYTYVYASYIDEPVMRSGSSGLRYYHRNQQYSVIALTNGSGTITQRYAYSAYGTPTITDASGTELTSSADNNRYTYTGREWDSELNLYHYRARMYDSDAGRFCSRDPMRFVDGYNLYENQMRLTNSDPFGLSVRLTQTVTDAGSSCTELSADVQIHILVTQPLVQSANSSGYAMLTQRLALHRRNELCIGKCCETVAVQRYPLCYVFETFGITRLTRKGFRGIYTGVGNQPFRSKMIDNWRIFVGSGSCGNRAEITISSELRLVEIPMSLVQSIVDNNISFPKQPITQGDCNGIGVNFPTPLPPPGFFDKPIAASRATASIHSRCCKEDDGSINFSSSN